MGTRPWLQWLPEIQMYLPNLPFRPMHAMNLPRITSIALLSWMTACSTIGSAPTAPARPVTDQQQSIPAEALNPDVRQDTIAQTICLAAYTRSIRPSTTYTNGVKAKLLREQGLAVATGSGYELDHRIPLALGGHPRSPSNLMLQPWTGEQGALKKDRLERKLQTMVCSGALLLQTARLAIYFNWPAAYEEYVGSAAPRP